MIRNRLAVLAFLLLSVSAAIHLSLGVAGLLGATEGSTPLSVGYLLFAIAAFVLIGGYATDRIAPTATYALGAGLVTLSLLAYADVHAFGYAESTLGLETVGHDHGGAAAHDHGHADGGHGSGDGHAHDHGSQGHGHDESEEGTLAVLAEHLRGDAYALVAKGAEAAAAVCFAVLTALSLIER